MRVLHLSFTSCVVALLLCAQVCAQHLLVNSGGGNATLRFDVYGIPQGVFASGQGMAGLSCIVSAPDGKVFTGMSSTQGGGRVQRRSASGALEAEYTAPGLSTVGGLALDGAGNLYVSDTASDRVLRWDAGGSYQGVFASGAGLSSPRGLAVDGAGGLLIASAGSGQVLRWKPEGSFDRVVADVLSPVDVESGSDGTIYVLYSAGAGGGVLELYPDGSVRCARTGGVQISAPTGLALRPGDEAMFVSDAGKGVLVWDNAGGWSPVILEGQSGLASASGLAFQTEAGRSWNTVNYQGMLTDASGNPLPDGPYNVRFALYAAESGGQPLWTSASRTVTATGGVFTTQISGIPEVVFESPEVWVEVTVGATTLSPRQRFSAVPYAFHSRNARSLATEGSPIVCTIGNVTVLRLGADSSFWARATGGATFVTALGPGGAPSAGVVLAPGAGAWSTLSDRAAKTGLEPVDPEQILERVRTLPINYWSYRSQSPDIRHIGPTAQDFRAAFEVGEDDRHISTVDADGVILAAIQGLLRRVEANDSRIRDLEERLQTGKGREGER